MQHDIEKKNLRKNVFLLIITEILINLIIIFIPMTPVSTQDATQKIRGPQYATSTFC